MFVKLPHALFLAHATRLTSFYLHSSRLEGQIRDTQDKLDDKRTQIIQAQAGAQAATSQTSKEQVAH